MDALKHGVVIDQLALMHYSMLYAGKALKVSAWLNVGELSMVKSKR